MLKVSDRDLELLAKSVVEIKEARGLDLSRLIGEGEPAEFYRGVVGELIVAHSLLRLSSSTEKGTGMLISLATGYAAEMCRNLRGVEDAEFPDIIGIM